MLTSRERQQTDPAAALRRLKVHLAAGEIGRTAFVQLAERICEAGSTVGRDALLPHETESCLGEAVAPSWVVECPAPETGDLLLERWRIGRRLGGRPPCHVFLADDDLRGERVVVRVVASGEPIPEPVLERIRHDASSLRAAPVPGCVQVLDVVEAPLRTTVVVVLRCIDGESLGDLAEQLRRDGEPVDAAVVAEVAEQLLTALAALHGAGLSHRRLDADCVLLVGGDGIAALDPGLVEVQLVGIDVGGVLCECSQAAGVALDGLATGRVLAEMATGWSPEEGDPPPQRHLTSVLGPPLARVVRALAAAPWVGLLSAEEALAAVAEARAGTDEEWIEERPQLPVVVGSATTDLDGEPDAGFGTSRRRAQERERESAPTRWWFAVAAVVVVLGVGLALLVWVGSNVDEGATTEVLRDVVQEPPVAAHGGLEDIPVATGTVAVTLEAERADGVLWLDGEQLGPGPRTVQVRPGRHLVAVTGADGCRGEEHWIVVSSSTESTSIQLEISCPSPSLHSAGEVRTSASSGARFRFLPPGAFQMGSAVGEPGRFEDEQLHQVSLTRGFWMGETEVTQAQWLAVMETAPSHHGRCGGDCPVENISWFEAVAFANAMSHREQLLPCYRIDGQQVVFLGLDCPGFRLPTEAEWEYAARSAATEGPYATGQRLSATVANFAVDGHGPPRTFPVGRFPATGWGLYDLHGNVREWVWDWYGPYRWSSEVDPVGPAGGLERVTRGGGCADPDTACRVAARGRLAPDARRDDVGLRLARTAHDPE